jgi:hypothetical protein
MSRRGFLTATGLAATAVTFGSAFGITSASAQAAGDDVQTIINIAATAEAFAVTHYYRALAKTTKAQFTAGEIAYLKAGLESEQAHFDFLVSAGAKPLYTTFFFPKGTFDDKKTFGAVTGIAETVFVAAYIAAAYQFAVLGHPDLSAIAAQVAAVEAQHLALVNQIAGTFPNNIALGAAVFGQVSEAVPVVMPLLDGKKGALGDMETATVNQPSAADVKTAVGKSNLIATLSAPFTTAIAPFKAPVPAMSATMAATKSS